MTDQSCITVIFSSFKHQSYLLKLWKTVKWSSPHDNNKFFTDENYACFRQTISHCTVLSYFPTKRTTLNFSQVCTYVTTLAFLNWANLFPFPLHDIEFGMSFMHIVMQYIKPCHSFLKRNGQKSYGALGARPLMVKYILVYYTQNRKNNI